MRGYDIEGSVAGYFDHKMGRATTWKECLAHKHRKAQALAKLRSAKALALAKERAKEVERKLAFRDVWKH